MIAALDYELGELPVEFHARLAQLLRIMPGATLAGVQPGKQPGSWRVELAFPDRVERAVIIYASDAIAV
jgi:hypothetical protein